MRNKHRHGQTIVLKMMQRIPDCWTGVGERSESLAHRKPSRPRPAVHDNNVTCMHFCIVYCSHTKIWRAGVWGCNEKAITRNYRVTILLSRKDIFNTELNVSCILA